MNVVGTCELTGSPERLPGPDSLGDHRGHGEPGEGEPGQGGQDEEPDEQAHRQEDQDSHSERGHVVAESGPPPEDENARRDVADREERSAEDEQGPLGGAVGSDRELIDGRDHEPEREHAPEAPLVEPDRVGDELPDGSVGR